MDVRTIGPLRGVLEGAVREHGFSMADLTVLSLEVDPYRLDTPAGHRDGQWVAQQLDVVFTTPLLRLERSGSQTVRSTSTQTATGLGYPREPVSPHGGSGTSHSIGSPTIGTPLQLFIEGQRLNRGPVY
jgi:hypothetical protein